MVHRKAKILASKRVIGVATNVMPRDMPLHAAAHAKNSGAAVAKLLLDDAYKPNLLVSRTALAVFI